MGDTPFRLAVAASLQGWPEESSPETPTDATRIARYIGGRLATLLRGIAEVRIFDRAMYPGAGDCYLRLAEDIGRWGANAAAHIHQDAAAIPTRGWCVLWYWQEALPLANHLVAALRHVPSPFRGLIRRTDVAVLKRRPTVSVLVECGFYTSPEDEAIGTEGWGEPVVQGILSWLSERGIVPVEKEEVIGVPKVVIPQAAIMGDKHVYHVPCFHRSWWLDMGYEGEGWADVEIWVNEQIDMPTGGKAAPIRLQYRVPGTLNPDHAPGVHIRPLADVGLRGEWVVLSIHSPVHMTILIGP